MIDDRALLASLGVATALLCGCVTNSTDARGATQRTAAPTSADEQRQARPAEYESCPPSGISPPADMVLVDRRLPNLGQGYHGRVETHEDGAASLEIAVGFDMLGQFEDLDFDTQLVDIGGNPATLSTAGAFGTDDRLVILSWVQPDVDEPCSQLTLVGTNLSADSVLEIAIEATQS